MTENEKRLQDKVGDCSLLITKETKQQVRKK